jgi:hypothetical protein
VAKKKGFFRRISIIFSCTLACIVKKKMETGLEWMLGGQFVNKGEGIIIIKALPDCYHKEPTDDNQGSVRV